MAIFASTTTSGYSDPLKALSIKALEQRQRDMQAQMAQQQAQMFSPENTQTPIQGFGQLANVIGDRFQQNRADAALGANKQQLAQIMSGYDAEKGLPPAEMAKVAVLSPDLHEKLLTQLAAARAQQAGFTHADKAAAEAARVAREAKIDEEQRLANRPASDAAKIMQDVQSGKISPELGKAMTEKLTAPSAAEMKAGNELQNTSLDTQSAISDLKEARALLGSEGTGIRAGSGAGWAQPIAKYGGDKLGVTDPNLTQPTERYNQLMNAEAITAMAAKLKGASTDYEMKAFVALMNDPNAEGKTKVQALDKMIAKAEAHAALQADQMKRARVQAPTGIGGAPAAAAPQASPQDAQALEWAKANQNDPRAAEIMKRLGK